MGIGEEEEEEETGGNEEGSVGGRVREDTLEEEEEEVTGLGGETIETETGARREKTGEVDTEIAFFCMTIFTDWLSNNIMELPSLARACTSIGLSLAIALYGLRRKSLSRSGALSAIAVGIVLTSASACFCLSLLAFFLTSSRLTKWKSAEKKKLEHDHKEGECNWRVFASFDL